ncbi:MAG: chemotaxis protein CheA [Syntrophobacteraceae bacterium]
METILVRLANGVVDGPDDLMGIGDCLNMLDDLEKNERFSETMAKKVGKLRLLFKGLILEESADREADWQRVKKLLGGLTGCDADEDEDDEVAFAQTVPAGIIPLSDEDTEFFESVKAAGSGNGSDSGESGLDFGQMFSEADAEDPESLALQDPELVKEFIEESKENLSSIELNMLALETDPTDSEAINAVFRPFHSIKGVAGFLNFTEIHHLSHEVENLLDMARSGKIAVTDSVIDIVLTATDILKVLLGELEGVGEGEEKQSGSPLVSNFLERVKNFAGDTPAAGVPVRKVGAILTDHCVLDEGAADEFAEMSKNAGKRFGETVIEEGAATPREVSKALREQRHSMESASSVRVDTRKLDNLVDMVGELVIAQSMVLQNPEVLGIKDQKYQKDSVQLNRITAELQRISMSMRMVPIKATFQKMIRLVRDLSKKSGKEVNLQMQGEDTEIDRNMVEEIYEPLVHMIRNSVDHGIELPEDRVVAGKDPVGTVMISAEQKGGNIVIDIRDDGKGLDSEKIRSKAVERGIIGAAELLDEKAIFDLVFHAGFSTKDKVTEVSGRGVGMDVVKKCVERLRGKMEVSSVLGKGSHFQMKLPLTMAIIDGMVIQVGPERFIVPTVALKESLRPARDSYYTLQGRGEMVKVRDLLMPLVRLHTIFGEEPRYRDPWEGLLLVVTEGKSSYCLLADEIVGRQEVVIKSLGGMFRMLRGVSGGAILGDGKVALIVDVKGIISLYEDSANDGSAKRRLE